MCALFGLQTLASFSLQLYSESNSVLLCEYWVAKHQHWFDIWRNFGLPRDRAFGIGEVERFIEPAAFSQAARSAGGPLAKRIAQLRSLRPARVA